MINYLLKKEAYYKQLCGQSLEVDFDLFQKQTLKLHCLAVDSSSMAIKRRVAFPFKVKKPGEVVFSLSSPLSDPEVKDLPIAIATRSAATEAEEPLIFAKPSLETQVLGVFSPPEAEPSLVFNEQKGVERNQLIISNEVSLSKFRNFPEIAIAGGSNSVNDGPWVSDAAYLSPGDRIRVQLRSASEYQTETSALLAISSQNPVFKVSTRGQMMFPIYLVLSQ